MNKLNDESYQMTFITQLQFFNPSIWEVIVSHIEKQFVQRSQGCYANGPENTWTASYFH